MALFFILEKIKKWNLCWAHILQIRLRQKLLQNCIFRSNFHILMMFIIFSRNSTFWSDSQILITLLILAEKSIFRVHIPKISHVIKICESDQNVEFRLKMINIIKIWKLDRNMEFCSNFWRTRIWSIWAQHKFHFLIFSRIKNSAIWNFFHHILLNETKYKSFIHNVIKCRHVW